MKNPKLTTPKIAMTKFFRNCIGEGGLTLGFAECFRWLIGANLCNSFCTLEFYNYFCDFFDACG